MTRKREHTSSVVGTKDPTGAFRHGFGLKNQVETEIAGDYVCPFVEDIKRHDYHLDLGQLQVYLAREFGFCYGVDKAVDYAYQTRRMFPNKRIFLTTEIIHNPRVNRRLQDMGIEFLSGQYRGRLGLEDVKADDVVVLPAFGASVADVEKLRARGCTLVDTTCGSVIHVWKRVEKYAREGFAAIIHGKYSHEETIATSSHVAQYPGGAYLVVRNKSEAQLVCDFIAGKSEAEAIRSRFRKAMSPGFDPEVHLQRVGVANQTTMLSSESLEIAEMLREAMALRYGRDFVHEHFRNFDTICSATQERQDAVHDLVKQNLDLILVVGGFNSSNTTHLIEIASKHTPAYHIQDVGDIVSREEIVHKRWNRTDTERAQNWLPPLPTRIGFTAGASTPNRAIGDVIERVISLFGIEHQIEK